MNSLEYRPKILSEMFGKNVQNVWSEIFESGKIPSYTLLLGSTGTGKTTLARIISKTILCENKDDKGNVCNKCQHCTDVDSEQFSYVDIYNASNINIEIMRDIESSVLSQKTALVATKKVIIIDELQELKNSPKAMNVLLQLFDRKVNDVYVIMTSMDSTAIPNALRDRTLSFTMPTPSVDEITQSLSTLHESVTGSALTRSNAGIVSQIAEVSEHSFRRASEIYGRVVESNWDTDTIMKTVGVAPKSFSDMVFNAVKSRQPERIPRLHFDSRRALISKFMDMRWGRLSLGDSLVVDSILERLFHSENPDACSLYLRQLAESPKSTKQKLQEPMMN